MLSTAPPPLAVQPLLPTSSVRRRKPQFTYQSPSAGDTSGPITLLTKFRAAIAAQNQHQASSSSSPPPTATLTPGGQGKTTEKPPTPPQPTKTPLLPFPSRQQLAVYHHRMAAAALPLYHPMGKLAMSLPPLDPTSLGLPAPASADAEKESRTTADGNQSATGSVAAPNGKRATRSRRPVPKLREVVDVEGDGLAPSADALQVQAEPAAAAAVAKEKPAGGKKRRGGGAGSKRKRKELDDPDAAYPAKRQRVQRNVVSAPVVEDESEGSGGGAPDKDESTPTERDDDPEDRPDRRVTRPRVVAARRDSTGSDGAEKKVDVDEDARRTRSRSKESGEISEDIKP